jgi:plasmid stabilization system protein ParE
MPNEDEQYKVTIQDPATEMLIQHTSFLAQSNPSAAKRLTEEFVSQARTLETMPERCPWLYSPLIPEHKYRKLIFEKHYMLVFQIIGNGVFVDAMVDCRQDYAWLL